MLHRVKSFAAGVVLLMLAACAGTTPLQVEDVGATGRQYTDTLKKVNAFALDHSLEFTADLLPGLPRDDATLQNHTDAMRQRVQGVRQVAEYLDVQALYFAELNAFAKGDRSQGAAKALKKLVEALNKLPDAPGIRQVSKDAAAGLAGHVAAWRHDAQVRQVLTRDAEVVARALLLNQQVLQAQIDWIEQREALARQLEYRDKVQKPFVGEKTLNASWKKTWIGHVKQPPAIELLQQAKAASTQMQQAWLDVLRGQGNFEYLQHTFDQLNHNLQAASQHEPQ